MHSSSSPRSEEVDCYLSTGEIIPAGEVLNATALSARNVRLTPKHVRSPTPRALLPTFPDLPLPQSRSKFPS